MFTEEQKKMLSEEGLYQKNRNYQGITFDEETIRQIFGHEAAEDEEICRLKKYYVKTDIYNTISSSLPLYILVGHKGVGKSALFKVLSEEDIEKCNIAITIQPDDILGISVSEIEFLKRIHGWKEGLSKIVFRELIFSLSEYAETKTDNTSMKEWISNVSKLLSSMFGKKIAELQESYLDITNAQLAKLFKDSLFKEKKMWTGWKMKNLTDQM